MDVLEIVPVTAGRWDDLVLVMGGCSYARKCWCAYWYLPNAQFKAGWGDKNRETLERLVKEGAEPGLIAYVDGSRQPGSASRHAVISTASTAAGISPRATARMSGRSIASSSPRTSGGRD